MKDVDILSAFLFFLLFRGERRFEIADQLPDVTYIMESLI